MEGNGRSSRANREIVSYFPGNQLKNNQARTLRTREDTCFPETQPSVGAPIIRCYFQSPGPWGGKGGARVERRGRPDGILPQPSCSSRYSPLGGSRAQLQPQPQSKGGREAISRGQCRTSVMTLRAEQVTCSERADLSCGRREASSLHSL